MCVFVCTRKSMYKWYKSINEEPGFNSEAIRHITEYKNTIQANLFVTLIMDEMAIHQQIEFNGSNFCGVVDVGNTFACNTENLVKEAWYFCYMYSWLR